MGAAGLQSVGDRLHGMPLDHLLIDTIRVQGVCHERRSCVGWGIESLPMQQRVSLHPVKQHGASQEVEKIIRVEMTGMMITRVLSALVLL